MNIWTGSVLALQCHRAGLNLVLLPSMHCSTLLSAVLFVKMNTDAELNISLNMSSQSSCSPAHIHQFKIFNQSHHSLLDQSRTEIHCRSKRELCVCVCVRVRV